MYINRYDLLTAIINAQDNNDSEYRELLSIYKKSLDKDIKTLTLTKSFFINDVKLIDYINEICDLIKV